MGFPGVSVADDLNRPANRLHPSGMALVNMPPRWGMEEMDNGDSNLLDFEEVDFWWQGEQYERLWLDCGGDL